MKAIYASKLYKSSKYKDKIRANIVNPVNTELVKQLSEYLSEEAVEDVIDAVPDVDNPNDAQSKDFEKQVSVKHKSISTPKPDTRNIKNMSNSDPNASLDDTTEFEDDEVVDNDAESGLEDSESNVDESSTVTGTPIEACDFDIYSRVDEIKGLLNSRQDTSSVNRILIKDNEFWVYYNDSINLNNVMGPAIELLNAANYYYLEFNRLARSDNAIVFQINLSPTQVDPVDSDEK